MKCNTKIKSFAAVFINIFKVIRLFPEKNRRMIGFGGFITYQLVLDVG